MFDDDPKVLSQEAARPAHRNPVSGADEDEAYMHSTQMGEEAAFGLVVEDDSLGGYELGEEASLIMHENEREGELYDADIVPSHYMDEAGGLDGNEEEAEKGTGEGEPDYREGEERVVFEETAHFGDEEQMVHVHENHFEEHVAEGEYHVHEHEHNLEGYLGGDDPRQVDGGAGVVYNEHELGYSEAMREDDGEPDYDPARTPTLLTPTTIVSQPSGQQPRRAGEGTIQGRAFYDDAGFAGSSGGDTVTAADLAAYAEEEQESQN
eukprot:TRINITY_DN11590_c0_g1_i1.p1 TRINITY_DN11590_c0_g1~~TRINITY_DN11590_c0_g1_i1.p1  ORF type:complete len:265 (+),score=71.31 TRINITY_DN11590_c0_g1_i1:28-822(+)